ncbi:hypothetical protein NFO65_13465 [Neorhizobium galegae]|uniref:hypothetical protein n=1 Tax=Neorhizobium galegae TaxID=399 RepID=UPI0021016891|nr:hypothetical protein [Neorhizobium galegae]MCQ1571735.1 hypothetical protein [Neorhizobium galegae]
MKLVAVMMVAIVATGCETTLPSEMSHTEIKQLAQKIYQRCIDQGVDPKSAEMDVCTHQEGQREISARYENRETVRDVARGISKGAENFNRASTQSRPVVCNSTVMGPTVRTTCF